MEKTIDFDHFHTFGFALLRNFFNPQLLSDEVDHALGAGLVSTQDLLSGEVANFQYVPMMTKETRYSWSVFEKTETVAEALFDRPVIPTRVKAVRYSGNTKWHSDSTLPISSVGFLAYLDPLTIDTGALRVLPGSHYREYSNKLHKMLESNPLNAEALPSYTIETMPGDMIVFDEHIFHSSSGGSTRRQWRVDFLADPKNDEEVRHAKSYFSDVFQPDWDGKYDVDKFPCYGVDWLNSKHASMPRLRELGVYDLAKKQEEFTRSAKLS